MSAGTSVLAGRMAAVNLGALCAMCGVDVSRGVELCRACRAAFAPVIARGRQAGERWWVLAAVGEEAPALHAPALGEVDALAWGEGAPMLSWVLLACGGAAMAGRASAPTGRGVERCARCAGETGYPPGLGPPDLDPACASVLAARLGTVRP